MKSPQHPKSLLAALLALSAPALLHAQSTAARAEGEVVILPSFSVTGEQTNEYRAVESSAASRIRGNIKDTPASISVLTPEFLELIAPGRVFDATRYVAGISEGRGDGFADRQIIRGFENLNRTVDNFASIQGENVDQILVDHVEVLKGPSAIIAPTGAPGGVVTVASKAPKYTRANSIAATVGLFDAQRLELDMTGAFSADSPFAYRVVGVLQDSELANDGTKHYKKIIGASVSYRISPKTMLTLRGSYEDRWVFVYLPVFISSSSVGGADATLANGFTYNTNRNGTESWAHRGGNYKTADLLLTTSFNDHISSRFAAKYQHNVQRDQFMAASTPGLSNRYNPYTGIQTPDQTWAYNATTATYVATNSPLFDITNIQRQPFLPQGYSKTSSAQYDIAAAYNFAGVTSTTVAGVAVDQSKGASSQKTGAMLPFNLLAPVYGAIPTFTTLQSKASSSGTAWQYYINEQLSLFKDKLLVTAGLVRVDAHSENLNEISNVKTILDDAKNLALYGVVLKPVKDISLYASRSVNAVPTIANNKPLWQEGQQWEFGSKFSFLNDRLSLTVAHFQIAQTNVTVPNPAYQTDTTQPQSLVSDIKNHGYELEVMGGITKNLSVVGSLTWLKERDSLGRHVRAIADRNAALLLNYRFTDGGLKGLSAFIGVTHTGRRSGEATAINFTALGVVTQPSFYLAPVTLVSVGGKYTWKNISFALNIDNALDKEYIGIPTARTNAGLGLPRNIRLTTTYRF